MTPQPAALVLGVRQGQAPAAFAGFEVFDPDSGEVGRDRRQANRAKYAMPRRGRCGELNCDGSGVCVRIYAKFAAPAPNGFTGRMVLRSESHDPGRVTPLGAESPSRRISAPLAHAYPA